MTIISHFLSRVSEKAFCLFSTLKKEGEDRVDKRMRGGIHNIENIFGDSAHTNMIESMLTLYLYLSVTDRAMSFVLV